MFYCSIDLDAFRLDENLAIYVYGEADLKYEKTGDSYYFTVEEITIAPHYDGGMTYVINKSILKKQPNSRDALLFRLITNATEEDRNGSISYQIRQREAEDPSYK